MLHKKAWPSFTNGIKAVKFEDAGEILFMHTYLENNDGGINEYLIIYDLDTQAILQFLVEFKDREDFPEVLSNGILKATVFTQYDLAQVTSVAEY